MKVNIDQKLGEKMSLKLQGVDKLSSSNRRKLILFLILPFLFLNFLEGQTTGPLTNSTIVKMVKAKLSDDLIIDEINGAEVNFNLSPDSLKFLENQNVSAAVMQAMKDASGIQNPPVTPPVVIPAPIEKETIVKENPVQEKEDTRQAAQINRSEVPETVAEENLSSESSNYLIEKSTSSVNSMSYVNPLNDLIVFYDNQFTTLMKSVRKWDTHVQQSLEKEKQLMGDINKTRQELSDKKNANPNRFSPDITNLKIRLANYRTEHTALKEKIRTYGKNLTEELGNLNKSTINSIEDNFGEVIKKIKKTDPDPSISGTDAVITIPRQKFKGTLVVHVAPLNTIPVCFENEILLIRDTISLWTAKAKVVIQKDSILKTQLDPLTKKLDQYLQTSKDNQKLNKLDITALKKQCATITKERKNLAKQMENDSETLSENLGKLKEEVVAAIQERFMDAIENIDQSYQDKF